MVLRVSIIISCCLIVLGLLFRNWLEKMAPTFLSFNVNYFGVFYLFSGFIVVGICAYLAFSKFGNIKLGKDTEKPEFSTVSWISMLFAAGMAIGLVFWATAEPITHYLYPPQGEGSTAESADTAIKYTFFHWGLQPWGLYGIIGLGMAYFQFRKGLPARFSSIFYPLLKERIYGPIGNAIDIFVIIISAIGLANSFGLGALQISEGANIVWGLSNTTAVSIVIIIIGTILFMMSAVTGLKRGIKYLSNFNMLLALLVTLFIFGFGPAKHIIDVFITGTGGYLNDFLSMSTRLAPFNSEEQNWISNWTVFYLAWWLSCAPFVGAFIARVSRGRTIKEFVLAVLVVPSLMCFVWFSVFGGTGIYLIHELGNTVLGDIVSSNVTTALFAFLDYFPMSSFTSILVMLLSLVFFITQADSGAFVLAMFSSEGSLNPPNRIKLIWGGVLFSYAIILVIAGGLETAKSVLIVFTSPLALLILIMCYAILKGLIKDETEIKSEYAEEGKEVS
ncbi:BCCT family transporter [Oceanobacillus sp. FSL W7-1281]|uniref:BCCT family transporter n=1 Tax=Oceanobacillus sp. FSL W7-1281 TaxID=2921698 RepID=UPI0030D916F0